MAMTRLEQGCSSKSTEETHLEAGPNAPPNIANKEAYHVGLILGKDGVVVLAGFRELSLGLEPHSEETLDAGGVLEALLEAGQAYLRHMRGEGVRGAKEDAENRSVLFLHRRDEACIKHSFPTRFCPRATRDIPALSASSEKTLSCTVGQGMRDRTV